MNNYVAWVYILTNKTHTVLYTGFTTNLRARIWEHSTKQNQASFTARYNVSKLVYCQGFLSKEESESAEAYIKGKSRTWKSALIARQNPDCRDMIGDITG
jgi:putative endonuclease